MFRDNKIIKENYYDKYINELDIFDQEFDKEVSEEEFAFGDNVFSFLQDLIEDEKIKEDFNNQNQLVIHFKKHCLRNITGRKSVRTNVYYDFTDVQEYSMHEETISAKTISARNNVVMFINDLYDVEKVIKAFRKLFEGNQTLVFGLACGFHNENSSVRLCLHSFATEYTRNYGQNTIDFLIQTPDDKTISLYAIDANYVETKINNEISKIPSSVLLKINH